MALGFDDAAALPARKQPGGDIDAHAAPREPAIPVWITLELVLYVIVAALAVLLRVAQLDHAPLNDAEAYDALAALRAIHAHTPGEALVAASPISFVLNALSFTFMPVGDLAARLPVALGGVLLTLSPALWRRYLSVLPPLIISLLLAISPVMGLASRTSSPVIWTMLLAVIGPWLVLRFVETHAASWGIAATAVFGAMIFLTEPAGYLVFIALGLGVIFAWITEEDTGIEMGRSLRALARDWPWTHGVLAAGLLVLLVGTGFLWLPSGLTAVGNVLWSGVEGFVKRTPGAPVAFPLWVALRYAPAIVVFGLIGSYRAVREGGFFERVLVGWFLTGLVLSVFYAGASAAHALWITLPLTVLVGLMITRWLTERDEQFWRVPGWGAPLHAVITLALWLAVGLSLVLLGKLLFELPGGISDLGTLASKLLSDIYNRNNVTPDSTTVQGVPVFVYVLGFIQLRVLITALVTLLVGILFFLVGSLWGARAAWRGFALGTFTYLILFGLSIGWQAAYAQWDDPRELWYVNPVTADVSELRGTLRDMSLRATGTPNLMAVTAQVPQDGALAWALRDYPNTVFVTGVGPEIDSAAVLMPVVVPQPPMGADYVGKDLVIRQGWDFNVLSWRDGLMWLYRNDSLIKPVPSETDRLWIRKDVYGVERVTEE